MKQWQKATLILLGLAAGLFLLSFAFPTEHQICEASKQTGKEECALYHFGPFALLTITNFLREYSELITGLATALLAVITWMLVALGKDQRDTTKRQLRAYVFPDTTTLYDGSKLTASLVNRKDQVAVVVTIKNSGQTPAKRVGHWAEIEVAPVNREWAMNPPAKLAPCPLSIIAPAGINSKSRWLNRAVSQQEMTGIIDGSYAIYVYGRIEYFDEFGDDHWGTYRMRYTSAAWPPIGDGGMAMDFCQDGNDSD